MPAKWSQWGSETVAGGGGGGGGLPLLAERAHLPVRWFAIGRVFFSSPGVSLLFLGFQVISYSVFSPFLQCVCLSTQRLIALAKGKMLMTKMKMGGQENESAQGKQC